MIVKGNPSIFQNFCLIKPLQCKQSHSEWFDVKWFTGEQLTHLDQGSPCLLKYSHFIYNPKPPVNLHVFRAFVSNVDDGKIVDNLKKKCNFAS